MAGAQPQSAHLIIDDQDLDDAELWAAVDSAAAASLSSSHKPRRPPLLAITNTAAVSRSPDPAASPQIAKTLGRTPQSRRPRMEESRASPDGEVVEENPVRPSKVARFSGAVMLRPLQQQSPVVTFRSPYSSPDVRGLAVQEISPAAEMSPSAQGAWGGHSMSGPFPSVTLFKQYQNAAMAILEKCDYTMVSGRPYIKKSGWRKISFYFNLSYEIRDKSIEFDDDRNVLRAEFTVRALMQGGRFADGWGSCERREKRFIKPNHDIPSIAETRAKNKACQDLLGIGEYRPGAGSELY